MDVDQTSAAPRLGALARAVGALLVAGALHAPAAAQNQLVWEDDFDGNSLDLAKWEPMLGNGCPNLCGWGNNELQFYRAENATVAGGMLTITAKEESFGGASYTSARLRTKDLGDWKYGRFEMRAKLPIGQGLWPAFWMLPTDSVYGVWAASGEIDIMEAVGHDPDRVLGTLHYGGSFPNNTQSGGSYTLPNGTFHDDFHVFALEWDEFEMRWYVDGQLYSTKTSWWSSGGPYPAPFDQRLHLLLNLAVGGNLPGPPNGTTMFPQTFVVDYVRVYQEQPHDPNECVCVFDDLEHASPLSNGYFTFDGASAGGGIGANTTDLPPLDGGSASLEAGWGGPPGYLGGFGRTYPYDISGATHFEFWIHPDAGQDFLIEVNLQDDDNGDDVVPGTPDGADDEYQYALSVGPSGAEVLSGGGWQRVSIPLASFVDDNTYHFGGNGVLDPEPVSTGGNGQLANIVFALIGNSAAPATFRTDQWTFVRRASSVSGRVWSDLDGNSVPIGEPGLDGVTVQLIDTQLGAVVATDVTNANGEYGFEELVAGSFEVRVDAASLPSGVSATYDPDGVATLHRFAVDLACDDARAGQDFGYAPATTLGTRYCSPAVANSTGGPGEILASGTTVALFNSFLLTSSGLPSNQFGYFITSSTQGLIVGPGGSQGDLCLGGQMGRFAQLVQNSGTNGTFGIQVDLNALPPPLNHAVVAGETWNFTTWYRDFNPAPTSNFTDGVSVLFQ